MCSQNKTPSLHRLKIMRKIMDSDGNPERPHTYNGFLRVSQPAYPENFTKMSVNTFFLYC